MTAPTNPRQNTSRLSAARVHHTAGRIALWSGGLGIALTWGDPDWATCIGYSLVGIAIGIGPWKGHRDAA